MAISATVDNVSSNRTAALKRLAILGGAVRSHITGNTLEVVLPQNRNAPIMMEVGYLIAQLVYPWPNWQAALFDLRESYPAYLKYEAYLLPRYSPWHFLRRAYRRLIANATELRASMIEHLRQFHIELRPREKQGHTFFMIPHDLEPPQYVLIGYHLAQYIYPHAIWQTKPLQIATRVAAQIILTVEIADRP